MKRLRWIALIVAAIVGPVVHVQRCPAETQCPWLNAATAEGVLGGEAQASATPLTVQGDTTCDFRRTNEFLRIAVHTMTVPSKEFATYLAQCSGTTVPLKAIGNEAVQCLPNSRSDKGEEQIIGRVRDRAFVITLKMNSIGPPTPADSGLSREARNIAEQVAGALF